VTTGEADRMTHAARKPATAARMYDYYLGGVHNFPADRDAARRVIAQFPDLPAHARANRAFLRRAVGHLADSGVRRFLDIGSGIPTEGNVHEIVQSRDPDARVVYVDIDPVAVAESLDILDGNPGATAVRADLRDPDALLEHPAVRRLLTPGQPVGLLLAAVLHFVPDNALAYAVVDRLLGALAPGSYLVVSHIAAEAFGYQSPQARAAEEVYQRQTSTPVTVRNRLWVRRFFTGLQVVDPGVVWLHQWRPDQDEPVEFADEPQRSGGWAAVGRKA
jgi:trans-aconitate methyltransferase